MRLDLIRRGLFASAVLLLCACEEHHVGEYPEVQRDRLAEARSEAHPAKPSPTATPVDFFPTQSPH